MDSGDDAPRRSYSRGTRVYVGGLNDSVKKEDLERKFDKYGKLNSVWVAFNPPGFAFIEFEDEQDAESACDSLNGQDIQGSTMRVEISRGRGRGGRGGFRGRSSFGGRGGYRGGRGDYGSSRGFRDYGGGGKMRGSRYNDYSSRDSGYSRDDKYGSRGGGDSYGSSDPYYESSSSRYRSRSPIGRGSSRDYSSGGYGGGRDSYSSRGRDSYGASKDSYSSRNGDGYGSSRRSYPPPRPRY